jgi:O-antigen/teichoic acid export membrane protein
MAAGQAAFFAIQFGGTVVLARILSPYEMGVYAVAFAFVGVLNLLQSFGLNNFIIREQSLTRTHVATAFTMNALIAVLLALLIALAGFLGGHWFSEGGVTQVLLALAVTPLIGIFNLVPYAQLERRGAFHLLVRVNMARQLLSTLCTVGLAIHGFSYLSLPYGQIVGSVTAVLLLNLMAREHIHVSLSLQEWRRVLTFGGQMAAISGLNALAARTSEIALGRITGLQGLGLYNRASTLFTLFWDNLHLVLGRVLFVDLAARTRNAEPLRGPYLMIAEIMTGALWPAFVGLALLARPLFHLVYGDQWVPAAIPFALLAISAVVQLSVTMTWELFAAAGDLKRQVKIEIVRTLVGTTLFVSACFISITAAAFARLLDSLFSALLYRPHVQRIAGVKFKDMMGVYARSAFLTAAATGPAAALMIYNKFAPTTPAWQVGCVIALGGCAWSVVLILLRHPLWQEALKAFTKLRRREPDATA